MGFSNALTERLGLRIPIVQAPMLGATDSRIVICATNEGAMGTLAGGSLTPSKIIEEIGQIRAQTKSVFGVNLLIVPEVDPDASAIDRAVSRLAAWRKEFGLSEEFRPNQWSENFRAQLKALTEAAPPVASFTFDCLSREDIVAMKTRGTFVMGTATDVREARAWESAGADAIVAQGYEAGGHHGAFLSDGNAAAVGTFALVPAVKAAVKLPVIAAGGIMDGAGIAAALLLGADAVQMGTAFLLSPESIISEPWRRALRSSGDDSTRLTRAYSGRYARGIENRFMREFRPIERDLPAYPVQNALTSELRKTSAAAGSSDALSLWAGQGVHAIREKPTAEIIRALWEETSLAIKKMGAKFS